MRTKSILPAMNTPDEKLEPTVRNAPRPKPSPGLWRKLFEQIASGPNQRPLSSSLRPSCLERGWRALATAALVGVGGIALAVQLEAAEAPTLTAAEFRTNGAPALSPGQPEVISWKDRQSLLAEGSNLTAAQVRVIEEDLKRDPANEAQWARLLGFYAKQSSETNALPFARAPSSTICWNSVNGRPF